MPKSKENTKYVQSVIDELINKTVRTRAGVPESRDIFFADAFVLGSIFMSGTMVEKNCGKRIIHSAVKRFFNETDADEFTRIFSSWKTRARLREAIKLRPHAQVRIAAAEYAQL